MKQANQSYLFAALSVLLWSTVATAFKISLQYFDVFQLIFIATGVSLLIFFFILILQGKLALLFAQTKNELFSSLLLGLLNPLLYYTILFKAYSLLPAQLAQPLNMTWPIAIALLSVPMLKQKLAGEAFLQWE